MPEDIVELEDEKQNRVRACQGCTTSLINQWTVYQRDQIPVEERAYVYESPLGMLKNIIIHISHVSELNI